MKFLLDHDVPIDISYSLSELGHEVVRLPEVLDPSARDEQVLEFASRNGPGILVSWHLRGLEQSQLRFNPIRDLPTHFSKSYLG